MSAPASLKIQTVAGRKYVVRPIEGQPPDLVPVEDYFVVGAKVAQGEVVYMHETQTVANTPPEKFAVVDRGKPEGKGLPLVIVKFADLKP